MKYSALVAVLTLLIAEFGAVDEAGETVFQEDCAGKALLSSGVHLWNLPVQRQDVPCLFGVLYCIYCCDFCSIKA